MSPFRAIIFDLDQTLLDRDRSLMAFLNWQCRGMLAPYLRDPPRFISRFIELDDRGRVWKDRVYDTLIKEFEISAWSAEELLSVYVNCFCAFAVPRAGAQEAVTALASRHKLGLISNGMSPFQERNFRALGFASDFDSVIVSAAVNLRKPDPQIFLMGCEQLGVTPSEAIYVGDNPIADIEGAKEAGLASAFVATAQHSSCPAADLSCKNLSELESAILRLKKRLGSDR